MPEADLSRLSTRAQSIMTQLIQRDGLSYADAIHRAEEMAEATAAPYREVARRLRAELAKTEDGRGV